MAKKLVSHVISETSASLSVITAKRICGDYLAESRSENTRNVIENYLKESIRAIDKTKSKLHILKNTSMGISEKEFDQFSMKSKYQAYRSIAKCNLFFYFLDLLQTM